MVLEKTLESPLDCKEIQPVLPKGDQSWVFIGRTDVEAETPILWPPHAKSWLIGKAPDAVKDWGQEEKGTEDEMVGWHHRLNGHGFGWTPGAGDGQGGLVCCSSWGRKELDMNERLNWTELIYGQLIFNQGSKNVQFGKDSLLNKGFWKNWTDTCKGMKPDYHHTPYTKINSNWIKDLKIRPENTELLEGNLVVSSLTLSLVMLSFNLTESKGNTKWTSGTSSN